MTAIFDKLLNGVRLVIVLEGMIALLGFIAMTPAYQNFLHAKQWTYAGVRETFWTAILLGLLLGWFFPVKVKKFCPDILVIPLAGLFSWGYFLFFLNEHVLKSPSEIKLADCSGSSVNFHLTAPPGFHYGLYQEDLPTGHVTQRSYISSYKFTGNLRITGGKLLITNAPLDSDKMQMIASEGELFFGPVNLKRGEDYDIQIEFNPPPPGSSIWLYWMQSAADRGY